MKVHRLDLSVRKDFSEQELLSLAEIHKLTDDKTEDVISFLAHNGINETSDDFGESFVCTLPIKGKTMIVGYVNIEQNDVRTKFSFPPDTKERVYHEFVTVVLDNRLFDLHFLERCFMQMIKQTVDFNKGKEEVFWFDCQGDCVSQVIDCGVLKKVFEEYGYEYFFINQAEYFAEHLNNNNDMNEISSFSALHENIQAVLEKPANYVDKITRFSAGGLGACAYSDDITVGELARCRQHEEYHIKCLHCGAEAYITQWAGKVGSGGYWEIKAYCPHCGKECCYDMHAAGNACNAHWTALRTILLEERESIKNLTNE